jgi:hypothetical protein
VHSCNAWAKDGVGISNVNWFDGTIFNSVASHHSLELSVRGVAGHGLSFASKDGVFNLLLGEPFVVLVYGLYHSHSGGGVQAKVGKTAADAVGFAIEDNFLAMGGGYNPFPTSMIADEKTVFLQLGVGEEIGDPVAEEPKMEQVLVPALLGCKISTSIATGTEGDPHQFEVV